MGVSLGFIFSFLDSHTKSGCKVTAHPGGADTHPLISVICRLTSARGRVENPRPLFSLVLIFFLYALRPVVGMDCAPFTLRQSRRAHTATSFLLFRKKSRSRCLSPCKRGLYTATGSLPTFCEDACRQKGTKDRQGEPFRWVPLWNASYSHRRR